MKVRMKKRVFEVAAKLGKALVSEGVAREVKATGARPKATGILMREYAVSKVATQAETATTATKEVDAVDKVDALKFEDTDAEVDAEAESKPKRRKRASEVQG